MKSFARINLSSVLSFVALAKEEALAKVDALRRGNVANVKMLPIPIPSERFRCCRIDKASLDIVN